VNPGFEKTAQTHRYGRSLLKENGRIAGEIEVRIPDIELLY